jgi:ligand-binding sensor domain-containing protein
MKNFGLILFILGMLTFVACKKEGTKSNKKEILSFTLKEQIDSATIDNIGHTVTIPVSSSTSLDKLCPKIVISEKATIKPASGDTVDFSNSPVKYLVTAEDLSTQIWQVSVNYILSNLNHQFISSIAIDGSNIKWIGADSGLYKSVENGFVLENILFSGKIHSLFFEQPSNTLWIGSDGGLTKVIINGSNISSTMVPSINLSNQSIQSEYIDSTSKRWFGTANGFSLNINTTWKISNFQYSSALKEIHPMDIEKTGINSISCWNGDYYFATNTYGLYRAFNFKDSIDAFTGATQWASPYNGNAVTDTMFVVFVDSKGNQWMGGTNGVQVHTGHDSKLNITSFSDVLPNLYIHAIAEAPDGKIWVGTEQGLAKYDGTNWATVKSGLPSLFITAIAFDKVGSAWIGTKMGLINIKN